MNLKFSRLQPYFVAEVSPVDLREAHDAEMLAEIRAGMDEYAVLVFRGRASPTPSRSRSRSGWTARCTRRPGAACS